MIYLPLHCHHQNGSCIKMGSDESLFNVTLIVRDELSHKTVSTDHNFWRERTAEAESNRDPSAYHPNALPLGQTGSHSISTGTCVSWCRWRAGWPILFRGPTQEAALAKTNAANKKRVDLKNNNNESEWTRKVEVNQFLGFKVPSTVKSKSHQFQIQVTYSQNCLIRRYHVKNQPSMYQRTVTCQIR